MNRSNHQYPPNPEDCCCYCSYKKDYTPRSCRDAKYAESSPDEDEDNCGHQTFRKNGNTCTRSEMYDNLLDIIDDQMFNTMSNLRKKARKFMKSEFEQSFSSDTTDHRCNHSDDIRSKDTNVKKKANEIDYQPQSTFLKKMVHQYQGKQNECSDLKKSDFPAAFEKSKKSIDKEQKVSSPSGVNQAKKGPSGSCCCKCFKNDYPNAPEESPEKKSGHVSRLNQKNKCRRNRKRRLTRNCDSGDRFEPHLKQPHENSCERCWRYASPSRSPVNKPDQRYNPNFRRGHSCTNLNTKKPEDLTDPKEVSACPCRQQSFDTCKIPDKVRPSCTSNLKKTPPKKSNRSQNTACQDCSAQFTPFSKASAFQSQTFEQSKSGTERFEFEYPSAWLCDASESQQRKCAPRPQSCDKLKKRNCLEKGNMYSSKMRNLSNRPQSLIPAPSNNKKDVEYHSFQQYTDECGRGRLEALEPCVKRNSPARSDSCQRAEMDISILRGDDFGENGSGEIGLENELNMNTPGLSTNKSELRTNIRSDRNTTGDENVDLNEIPFEGLNAGFGIESSPKISKRGYDKNKIPKKSSFRNKSPKSKSPKESTLGGSKYKKSPRGSQDRKGEGKKESCSPNEAQAYFKIPSKPKTPEDCGLSHPIRNCRCYPRIINDEDDELFCCHCDWKKDANNESTRVDSDEAGRSRRQEGCCSARSAFSEPHTFQECHPSTSQKPTLPNIDEFPEQLFDLTMNAADGSHCVVPCPYRLYMSKRPLNTSDSRSPSRNQCVSFRDENIFYENDNMNDMSSSENYPRYGNENTTFGNFNMSSQMNAGYGMEYPRKYCVMYMTKGKNTTGDDVEVLVEELSQPCPQEKGDRMTKVKEKMTRMYQCPTESMALRFQKGVPPCSSVPQKSRELYF